MCLQYDILRNSYYHWFTQFFFVLFMILMPILLLNMLIAMMGNTYSLVIAESEREWTMQWAKILLELEKALSPKESKLFLSQYTITISSKSEPERPALMVIKKMPTSKAKRRKLALNNWRVSLLKPFIWFYYYFYVTIDYSIRLQQLYKRVKITNKLSE